MYNPIAKKFVISRDVKFMEDKSWNEIVDSTCHNPFVVFDETPTTDLQRLQVQSSSSSGSDSDSNKNQRMRSLSDIYAQDDNDNLVLFAFLSSQPAYFEDPVKKKEWVDTTNNEILIVHQPSGFEVKEQKNKIYRLKEPTLYIKKIVKTTILQEQ